MREEKSSSVKIATLAICIAIVTVFTMVVRIPTGRGYLNLCDVAIAFIAYSLGPITAGVAGGVGPALADAIGGYPQWAVVSFIVHGLEGLVMALIVYGDKVSLPRKIIAAAACIVIVAGGYYVLSGAFITDWPAALAEIPGNIGQSAVGAVFGLLLSEGVKKAYPPVRSLSF